MWTGAMRPGQRRKLEPESPEAVFGQNPFLYIKRHFGYGVRYRGLSKNTQRLPMTLLGFAT